MEGTTLISILVTIAAIVGTVLWLTSKKTTEKESEKTADEPKKPAETKDAPKEAKKKKAPAVDMRKKKDVPDATIFGSYQFGALKGFQSEVKDASFNESGEIIAVAEEKTFRIFNIRSLPITDQPKYLQFSVPTASFSTIAVSATGEHLALVCKRNEVVMVFDVRQIKKEGQHEVTPTVTVPLRKDRPLLKMGWAGADACLVLFYTEDYVEMYKRGVKIAQLSVKQMQHADASISPGGDFFSIAAFTAEAKIWKIVRDKVGLAVDAKKVMSLSGHRRGLLTVGFSEDSKRALTLSKDGHAKEWNIDVRYELSEDAKCIGNTELSFLTHPDDIDGLAIGPNLKQIAVRKGQIVDILSSADGSSLAFSLPGSLPLLRHEFAAHSKGEKVRLLLVCRKRVYVVEV